MIFVEIHIKSNVRTNALLLVPILVRIINPFLPKIIIEPFLEVAHDVLELVEEVKAADLQEDNLQNLFEPEIWYPVFSNDAGDWIFSFWWIVKSIELPMDGSSWKHFHLLIEPELS